MTVVRLSDVFVRDVYLSYTAVNSPESSALVRSGVLGNSPTLSLIARAGGLQASAPFWRDIDASIEPNYSNDDPADVAVPNKIGSGLMNARNSFMNQSFGEMELVQELLNGNTAMQHIRNRFGTYWTRRLQRRFISMMTGVLNQSIATYSGDMLTDISGFTGSAANFGSEASIDAAYQLGENVDAMTTLVVHSAVMQRAVKNDEVVNVYDSEGKLVLRRYKEWNVIMDDTLPVSGSGANRIYTSFLFGSGVAGLGGAEGQVFGVGVGAPKVPVETYREPQAGNGGGLEGIIERKTWLLHPFGYNWNEAGGGALVEFSPTNADLTVAAKWTRVLTRQEIPFAAIKSKAFAVDA